MFVQGVGDVMERKLVVILKSMSIHHIDVCIQGGLGGGVWRITGFYGWPEVHNRHLSWKLLEELARQDTVPWVCVGDFNEILFDLEHKGGRDRAIWQMNNFTEAVDLCALQDILHTYAVASGQVVNFEKLNISFIKVFQRREGMFWHQILGSLRLIFMINIWAFLQWWVVLRG